MIVFGNSKNLQHHKVIEAGENNKLNIFNLSSISEKGEKLFPLIPPFPVNIFEAAEEKTFDIAYAKYILENDKAFACLMKIIYSEYEKSSDGIITYIMVESDDIRNIVTESLIKLIQQRYGINSNIVNELEDWDYVEASNFTITGLYNLDIDKERYSELLQMAGAVSEEEIKDNE